METRRLQLCGTAVQELSDSYIIEENGDCPESFVNDSSSATSFLRDLRNPTTKTKI